MLFHLDTPGFTGGYIGVDVFFVISGYLITRILKAELDKTNQLNFARFYLRRARRLLPALLVTVALTLAAAAAILAPPDLARAGTAAAAAVLSVSNALFWLEAGYFDAEALTKPLLHTWSLSVEEQFYLVWPAAFLLLARFLTRRALPIALAALAALSLLLSLDFAFGPSRALTLLSPDLAAWFDDRPAAIYFLTPFRAFELLIGALMVWATLPTPPPPRFSEPLCALGLALIALPTLLYTPDTLFPAHNALLPCLGTALLLYAGQAPRLGLILRNRACVYVGLVSYALYLVHWPLIVFYRYGRDTPLSLFEQLALAAVSFALAVAVTHLVEQPFRRRSADRPGLLPNPAFLAACLAIALTLVAIGGHARITGGWPARFDDTWARQALADAEAQTKRRRLHDDLATSPFPDNGRINVLVVGDSHGRDFWNILHQGRVFEDRINPRLLTCDNYAFAMLDPTGQAQTHVPTNQHDRLSRRIASLQVPRSQALLQQADVVVLAPAWQHPDELRHAHRILPDRASPPRIVALSRSAAFPNVPRRLLRLVDDAHANQQPTPTEADLEAYFYQAQKPETAAINVGLRAVAAELGYPFIDRQAFIHNHETKTSDVIQGQTVLFIDANHITLEAAAYFGQKYAADPAVRKALLGE
ncbi:MAG: acyltransferase [Planctomycetota bacterium]